MHLNGKFSSTSSPRCGRSRPRPWRCIFSSGRDPDAARPQGHGHDGRARRRHGAARRADGPRRVHRRRRAGAGRGARRRP